MATMPTEVNLGQYATYGDRMKALDKYRGDLEGYYKQANPSYQTSNTTYQQNYRPTNIWDYLGGILSFGTQSADPDGDGMVETNKTPITTTTTIDPWKSNVAGIGSSENLYKKYFSGYKPNKMSSGIAPARKNAMKLYLQGAVN